MFDSCDCRVLSGRGLCDQPIPHPEESHRVSLGVIMCNNNPLLYDELEEVRLRKWKEIQTEVVGVVVGCGDTTG